MVIVAKPGVRKAAAVAERRPVAASKVASPSRPSSRPSLPTGAAGQLEDRTRGVTTWARDIRSEMRKVSWPTREEATKLTTIVIVISVIVGLFLGGIDALFSALIQWFLQ